MRKIIARMLKVSAPIIICAALALFSASCGNNPGPSAANSASNAVNPAPTAAPPSPTAELTDPPWPTGEVQNDVWKKLNAGGTAFKLTDAQQALFDEYTKNLDIGIFKDANPVDVAQVYIECGIEGKWEAEYNLYDPNGVFQTKDEYHRAFVADMNNADIRTRRSLADLMFPYLNDGRFIDDGNNLGHILFDSPAETDASQGESATLGPLIKKIFRFSKNGDGIWLLATQNPYEIAQ
ncbi:MAG: hypothetical protein FWC55_02020 [Firmicutes bacterium]|nr:hypothetical protein [Bacillota bacterium]